MALRILSFLYFMTIWGFSPSMVAERFGSQCGQLEHQFFSAENMVLKNFVYKNKTVANHVICGRDCSLEKDCKSFNFYKCRGFCELNNATRKEHTEDFVEDQESLYFDMDEGTPIRSTVDKTFECFKSCQGGIEKSGYYTICPDGLVNCQQIYCEMETSSVKTSITDQTTQPSSTEPTTQPSSTKPTTQPSSTEPTTQPSFTEPTTQPSSTEPTTQPSSTEPTTQPSSTEPTTPFFSTQSPLPKLNSCQEFRDTGYSGSNVYTVYPSGSSAADMRVYCDMVTDDRGWIVFQRRLNGSVDFDRNWDEYKFGFGDPSGEYWLGNENLVALTSAGFTKLRVVLESDGETGYVEYDGVSVTGSEYIFTYTNYKLGAPAKNSLNDNKGKKFTTKDKDNDEASDGNCAAQTHGAWWFRDCTVKSHLNGEYEQNLGVKRGIVWYEWNQPIKACSMILRKP